MPEQHHEPSVDQIEEANESEQKVEEQQEEKAKEQGGEKEKEKQGEEKKTEALLIEQQMNIPAEEVAVADIGPDDWNKWKAYLKTMMGGIETLLLHNTHLICYFFLVINHTYYASLTSLFFPLSLFVR